METSDRQPAPDAQPEPVVGPPEVATAECPRCHKAYDFRAPDCPPVIGVNGSLFCGDCFVGWVALNVPPLVVTANVAPPAPTTTE